jgi:hypothetical protein
MKVENTITLLVHCLLLSIDTNNESRKQNGHMHDYCEEHSL